MRGNQRETPSSRRQNRLREGYRRPPPWRDTQRIEAMRVQLATMRRFVEDEELSISIADVEQKLMDLQMHAVDLRLTGQGQDGVRFASGILGRLTYLTRGLSIADFSPTDQELEVQTVLHTQLQEHISAAERPGAIRRGRAQ